MKKSILFILSFYIVLSLFSQTKPLNNNLLSDNITGEQVTAYNCMLEIIKWQEDSNGKRDSTIVYTIGEDNEPIFSFQLEESKKQVQLFICGRTVQYALYDEHGEIEFLFPDFNEKLRVGPIDFQFKTNGSAFSSELLEFRTPDTQYCIYSEKNKVGLKIIKNGKSTHLKGNVQSRRGSIAAIYSEGELYTVSPSKRE